MNTGNKLAAVYGYMRQAMFSPEFRIHPGRDGSYHAALGEMSKQLEQSHQRVLQLERALKKAMEASNDVPEDFIVKICNSFFRLPAAAPSLLEDLEPQSYRKLARSIERGVRRLSETLEDCGIECQDLTGQTVDDNRQDVDLIGKAVVDDSLTAPTIMSCERPAVKLRGKLIQTAKVVLARPSARQEGESDEQTT